MAVSRNPDQFADITEYKAFIRVTGSSLDTYYATLLQYATKTIQTYCRQRFLRQTVTDEYHNPRSSETIRVRQRPLVSITTLYHDPDGLWGQATGAFAAGTLLTSGTDYGIKFDTRDEVNSVNQSRCGMVFLLGGEGGGRFVRQGKLLGRVLEDAQGTIKLTYVAGFADNNFPADLVMATLMLTRALELTAKNAGWAPTSENSKYYAYTLSDTLNKHLQLQQLLAPYRGMGYSIV